MEWFPSVDPELPKAYERVWDGGVDVTAQHVETWPLPWSRYYREGQRPKLYPGDQVDWPDPATLPKVKMSKSRASRSSRHV